MSEPRIVVAALVRNEADRFFRSALEAWSQFADEIVVLDDWSDDATPDIVVEMPRNKYQLYGRYTHDAAWGKEAPARAQLWDHACEVAGVGNYVFILDADMVPARNPRPLLASNPDAVAFTLYDLWSADEYRTDGFWRGHDVPRLWLAKVPLPPAGGWVWPERGIHTGHFPLNLQPERVVFAPRDFGLLHYAYSDPELRAAKHLQYGRVWDQLSEFERAHADSILTEPTLERLPFEPEYTLTLPANV